MDKEMVELAKNTTYRWQFINPYKVWWGSIKESFLSFIFFLILLVILPLVPVYSLLNVIVIFIIRVSNK